MFCVFLAKKSLAWKWKNNVLNENITLCLGLIFIQIKAFVIMILQHFDTVSLMCLEAFQKEYASILKGYDESQ